MPKSGHPSQTDDVGQFRIYGLTPADYCLLARPRSSVDTAGADRAAIGYTPTFAPNAFTLAEAAPAPVPVTTPPDVVSTFSR